jgi:hypothetical protein
MQFAIWTNPGPCTANGHTSVRCYGGRESHMAVHIARTLKIAEEQWKSPDPDSEQI